MSAHHYMTAEDINRNRRGSGDEVGLATVYRVLTEFEAAGLVLKHNFEGGTAVYEIDRGGHHDHMVDVDTGRIIEFESAEIEKLQQEVAESMATSSRSTRWCCTSARSGRSGLRPRRFVHRFVVTAKIGSASCRARVCQYV